MNIVTDSGTDTGLNALELADFNIHVIPLKVTLDGKTYHDGEDIDAESFYNSLDTSGTMPITSQPSAGDFAELYRKLAAKDPDILSVHMTAGLSGTFHAALAGAEMVPEAKVIHIDTKTLSAAAGWQVIAAAKAFKDGLKIDKIIEILTQIRDASESMYTLQELKYLISGGRISHMKGLLASLLDIKPLIGVEKLNGTYIQLGQARTFKKALQGLVDRVKTHHPLGSPIHAQVLHAFNPDGGSMLRDMIDKAFDCTWLPLRPMSLVLGAHTGRSMVGVAFASSDTVGGII